MSFELSGGDSPGADHLIAGADRAAATGDLNRARAMLADAAEQQPGDASVHMKLAALHRAAGEPRLALASVARTLAIQPRDFTALLLRASLIEQLGDPGVGQAWDDALAVRPSDGPLPPQLAAIVDHGERTRLAWLEERAQKMKAAMADAEARGDAEERRRMERFRSNVLRKTRAYHSEPTHFDFPELAEREFHPPKAVSVDRIR